MKKVRIEQAVGRVLAHDITEVRPEQGVKRRAFRKGHIIRKADLDKLRRVGNRSVFVCGEGGVQPESVHEDEAAVRAAPLIAGANVRYDESPSEGKINFYAGIDGLFKVDRERLSAINALGVPSLPTIHDNFPVRSGKTVAAFRIIPLTCSEDVFARIAEILSTPLIRVKPYLVKKTAVIVTGNEVYAGKITDGFIPRLTDKLGEFDVEVAAQAVLPDDLRMIAEHIEAFSTAAELLFITGGTSVDPDDVTAAAMRRAGVEFETGGNPIQPGNNFTIGRRGRQTVCAVPAAALFYRITALDLFLPRLLAGERIEPREIVATGHGGLCHFCETCRYPICPFGKG